MVEILHATLYVKLQEHILFPSELYPLCDYRASSPTPFSFAPSLLSSNTHSTVCAPAWKNY